MPKYIFCYIYGYWLTNLQEFQLTAVACQMKYLVTSGIDHLLWHVSIKVSVCNIIPTALGPVLLDCPFLDQYPMILKTELTE